MAKVNLVLLSLALLLVAAWLPTRHYSDTQATTEACRVTVLDIGQGDAVLFRTADGKDILVDGGPNSSILEALDRNLPQGDRDLDVVILSHPDADHVAGLIPVLEQYHVATVLTTGVVVTTSIFTRWQKALETEEAQIISGYRGEVMTVGQHFRFEQLWPQEKLTGVRWTAVGKNGVGGTNDTSLVGRVSCGGSTIMMTGDISGVVEDQLATRPEEVRSAALKVSHHGSRFSSTSTFFQAVQPKITLISVSKTNRYGHPHPTVLDRLQRSAMPFRRTDLEGDITLTSDGLGGWK